MNVKIIAAGILILVLAAIQIPAQTIRSAYIGVILLQDGDVIDLFSVDSSDPKSIFHSGGLRSLTKPTLRTCSPRYARM